MSFQITGPGPHRQEDGNKMTILLVDGDTAYGRDNYGHPQCYSVNGGFVRGAPCSNCRIVAVWHDPPEPPEPPEGFAIRAGEYVSREGDKYTYGSPDGWVACSAGLSVCVDFGGYGYIASPKSSVVLTKREIHLFDEAALFLEQLGTMLGDKNATDAAAAIASLRKRIDDKGTYTPEASK